MFSCAVCHAQGDSAEVSILGWEGRKLSLLVAIQDYRQSPARNGYKRVTGPATILLYRSVSFPPYYPR